MFFATCLDVAEWLGLFVGLWGTTRLPVLHIVPADTEHISQAPDILLVVLVPQGEVSSGHVQSRAYMVQHTHNPP